MTYGYQMDGLMKEANYNYWNKIAFVTLNELTYLAAGFHPLLAGELSLAYLSLSDKEFKQFYEEIKRHGEDDLPFQTNEETVVKGYMFAEPKYEATFLIEWIKSKGLYCCPAYQPVMTAERKKTVLVNSVKGLESLPRSIFAGLLAAFNKAIGNEDHFERLLIEAENAGKLCSLNSSANLPNSPSIYYELTALISWAQQKKFILPEEIIPNNDDNIHPKRLKSFLIITLAMAVSRYKYIPYFENPATGTKSGSISVDVQNLAGLLRDILPEKFGEDLSFYIKPDIVKDILDEAVSKLLD